MYVNLSTVALSCCRVCLMQHIRELSVAFDNTTTSEFRYTCEQEINMYKSALAELSKI